MSVKDLMLRLGKFLDSFFQMEEMKKEDKILFIFCMVACLLGLYVVFTSEPLDPNNMDWSGVECCYW